MFIFSSFEAWRTSCSRSSKKLRIICHGSMIQRCYSNHRWTLKGISLRYGRFHSFKGLAHFWPMALFDAPCERPKASLVFWGDMKWDHLPEKGWFTHFQPKFHFCTLWKYQKSSGFLMFSGGYKSGALVENGLKYG